MNDYHTKSVAVYDFGTFVSMAIKLSEYFGKVYYHSPWQSSFPKSNAMLIGKGIPEIERVDDFYDIVDDVDLFVFPDVHCGGIQIDLENRGKRIWGSRKGEELELFRDASKKYLASQGIAIGPYEVVTGLNDLRAYLQEHSNQWVKMSITRGDAESFHSRDYQTVEPRLDELEWKLGAKKHIKEFIVEESIDDAVESGYDGYSVDGQFPAGGFCGIEIKDKSYIEIYHEYSKIPVEITSVNDKMSDTLKKYRYRNFISSEIRITQDRTPYLIDPCMRQGSPPSEVMQEMILNLADIIWNGADGILVDPVVENKYGVELIIHSQWADKNWQAIRFPEELKNQYKFRNLTVIGGNYYFVPQDVGLPEVGAVVATGNTIEEAVEKVKEYAARIESYDLSVFTDVLNDTQEEIDKLREWGIDIDG